MTLDEIVHAYRADVTLPYASTIPASWYTDPRLLELERKTVFCGWQMACRAAQVDGPGSFVATELPSGDPIVVVRGDDGVLRAFYNVCRHHAAAVVTDNAGTARQFKCPYHGWTYALDGGLKGTPDFAGVCDFDRRTNGLLPLRCAVWEAWVFVRPAEAGPALDAFLTPALSNQLAARRLSTFTWVAQRRYTVDCNWKVFVDNYLDGGYHVPHLHKSLGSVLNYSEYVIELGERFCLQTSPLVSDGVDAVTSAVRTGERAYYYWIYPNVMINCYGTAVDTNLVIPRGVDRTDVVFDFYFTDVSADARTANLASIEVSERIQDEDVAICVSVQRGLRSRAYDTGRLSVRREAGEHLFHRLVHADLTAGLQTADAR